LCPNFIYNVKKLFFFSIFVIFLISLNIYAQDQEWTNLSPTFYPEGDYNFSYGTFLNIEYGFFADFYPASVWKTNNGGYIWESQKEQPDFWLHDLEIIDSLVGYIILENIPNRTHLLAKTVDGGNSWLELPSPKIYNLTFLNDSTGFAGGDSIFQTLDAGKTWQPDIIQPETRFGISDIFFVDRQNGWAVGMNGEVFDMGIILKTTNGGNSWQVVIPEAAVTGMAVFFTDTLCGYVVGSNPPFFMPVIMSTKDGGDTWDTQYISDSTGGSWINDVFFINDSTGWCAGDYGYIWYTDNAGASWQRVQSGTHADLNRIVFVDDGRVGYIFGDDNTLLKFEREINSIGSEEPYHPSLFKLYQNYPNPFNSNTIINYELKRKSSVDLKVYDITGKEVITIFKGINNPGKYKVLWDGLDNAGKEVSSGIYLYQLKVEKHIKSKKMFLIH
jgi:hypothetical protein